MIMTENETKTENEEVKIGEMITFGEEKEWRENLRKTGGKNALASR